MSIRAASASLIQYLWCVFIMIAFNYTITDYTEVTVFLQHCWKFAGLMSETKSDFFFFFTSQHVLVCLSHGVEERRNLQKDALSMCHRCHASASPAKH